MKYIGFIVGLFFVFFACKSKEADVEKNKVVQEIEVVKGQDSILVISGPKKTKPSQLPVELSDLPLDFSKLPSEAERFNVEYSVLRSGANSPYSGGGIIRSIEDLQRLGIDKKDIGAGIDFSKQALVIAEAGTFPTGGFSISLMSAILTEHKLHLSFFVQSPAPDVAVTMAFTKPYIAVVLTVPPDVEIDMHIVGANPTRPRDKFSLE